MIKKILITLLVVVAACYGALAFLADGNGLTDVFLINELKTVSRYLVAVLGVMAVLRYWDLLLDVNFKTWLKEAPHDVKAFYFAFRVLSVCLLFGLLATA